MIEEKLNDIARAHLAFGVPQQELSYQLIARELQPAEVEGNEDFIRSVIARWNRRVVRFMQSQNDSEAVCGWKVNTQNPILDGMYSSIWLHYNCYQHEACPRCWQLTH